VVDLRHQLASALGSRDSQHTSAVRVDEAAEDLAVQVHLAVGMHRIGYPLGGSLWQIPRTCRITSS